MQTVFNFSASKVSFKVCGGDSDGRPHFIIHIAAIDI